MELKKSIMVHKIKETKLMNDLNDCFVELIKRNIKNKRQSVIFLNNHDSLTVNSRDMSVKYYDDVLKIYRADVLKDVIDINSIIAVVTK